MYKNPLKTAKKGSPLSANPDAAKNDAPFDADSECVKTADDTGANAERTGGRSAATGEGSGANARRTGIFGRSPKPAKHPVLNANIGERVVMSSRIGLAVLIAVAAVYLLSIFFVGIFMSPELYASKFADKFLSPSPSHPFGTDFTGRDMFFRSIKGMSTSLVIGLIASAVSSVIGLVFGISSAIIGGKFDKFILWCIDCCMGLPHLVLLVLISFMLGRGAFGVTIGVALTHWPELTRLVRAEVLQLRAAPYVLASRKMGMTKFQIAKSHIVPHVLPVYLVGLVLLFPHAIMHEASITFLGFGLPPESPAIGVILAESMKHIATGKWWLALFPGLMLLTAVLLFDLIGENLKRLLNPTAGNE